MNKTIEAFLRGYLIFRVNEKNFYRYNSALRYQKSLENEECSIIFSGFNPFLFVRDFFSKEKELPKTYKKGWRGFYERFHKPKFTGFGFSASL